MRLDPITATPTATVEQIAHSVELRLQMFGSLAAAAIADAWDTGRIAKPDSTRPPFADEVGGLLRLASGLQPDELGTSIFRLRSPPRISSVVVIVATSDSVLSTTASA